MRSAIQGGCQVCGRQKECLGSDDVWVAQTAVRVALQLSAYQCMLSQGWCHLCHRDKARERVQG